MREKKKENGYRVLRPYDDMGEKKEIEKRKKF